MPTQRCTDDSWELLPGLQSAYRQHHSTETSVLKVLADILHAVDTSDLSILALLNLSAAFDTVDHDILLQRLQASFGVVSVACDRFWSYLTGRVQFVCQGSSKSTTVVLRFGVPRGSVLRPLLFILYTANLITLIEGFGFWPHAYTDDTQVQGSCLPDSADQLQLNLSACLADVSDWMHANWLQLNTSKTEIVWCTTSCQQHRLPAATIQVSTNDSPAVR